MKKAVILFSGGLDSTTCLAIAQDQGFACYTLNFDYDQRHRAEIVAATRIAKHFNAIHHTVDLKGLGELKGSALTDQNIAIPDYQSSDAIPSTYVPARNTVFLSIALGYAETIGAHDIFIGANAIDYSGYPDCRPEYIEAFQAMANLATKAAVEGQPVALHAPLINLTKSDIIQKGHALNIDYGLTVSCYQADDQGRACGQCDACTFRKKGFADAGIADPTCYF